MLSMCKFIKYKIYVKYKTTRWTICVVKASKKKHLHLIHDHVLFSWNQMNI